MSCTSVISEREFVLSYPGQAYAVPLGRFLSMEIKVRTHVQQEQVMNILVKPESIQSWSA